MVQSEARYKALLIGASNYGTPGIEPLPFVPDDLERMAAAFVTRGFHQANVAQFPYATPNEINGEVTRFLGAAGPGDHLVIVLSGHGVHYNGRDYLVPEDIQPELFTFAKGCVEIGWGEELEECPAEQVIFLIDACREGIQRDTKGTTAAWSSRKAAAALRRKVAYVYACSQGQYARFVRPNDTPRPGHDVGTEPGESFSLFSRAVSDLLRGHASGPGDFSALDDFRTAAQQHIDSLHAAYGKPKPAQRVRVLTEQREADFTVFPPTEMPSSRLEVTERVWTERITTHLAWKLTARDQADHIAELKEACRRLAAELARSCTTAEGAIADDAWYDRTLAERITERVGFLVQRMADTSLSPTEAALLTVLPFAAQAHWARQAAGRRLSADELGSFLKLFPRLSRRLRNLKESQADALRDIHWWGYHRWLAQQPETYAADHRDHGSGGEGTETWAGELPPSYSWIRSELSAARLLRYLKEQRIAPTAVPGSTRTTELAEEHEVAPSTAHEHTVRERLVSTLLKAAHALAIDPADLPEVLVEHLGISDSVSLDALHTTIRQSHWQASGTGRSLSALCQHPAVELALKQHVESVDALLRDINHTAAAKGSSLAPLSGLPAYANAQHVKPSGATPPNLSTGIRFRLADDRVQELLMGEQLYGDRALAVRELYQNGLDALRYRDARTAYLRRTGVRLPEWQGEVTFRQGTDERGRPYLECEDNGIGMGVTELSRSFSQGGARFVDLPEYLEEGVLWAALDPPVELHPVSRFGLGVLSYFMIADELMVWTCRLDRDGRPGRLLKVTIAGPGNLFRVEDEGPGIEAGTRVRLISTPERGVPSSADELGKYLWVSPFRVTAPDGEEVWVRDPGVLAATGLPERTPTEEPKDRPQSDWEVSREPTPYLWSTHLAASPLRESQEHDAPLPLPRVAHAAPPHGVWWTSDSGSVLVDGIAADRQLFGRAVDLHGSEQVTLSVDRKKILSYDEDLVHERCMAALDDLVEHPDIVTPPWLCRVHREDPVLAEAATARATSAGMLWTSGGWTLDAGRLGLFPPDLLLLPAATGAFADIPTHHDEVASLLLLLMPEPVVRWRLRALLGLQAEPGEPVALPSDIRLLSADAAYTMDDWERLLEEADTVFREKDKRGSHSSLRVWSTYEREQLRELIVRALRSLFPWRPAHRPVTGEELTEAAAHIGIPLEQAAQRLRRIGYQVIGVDGATELASDDLAMITVQKPAPPSEAQVLPAEKPMRLATQSVVPLAHLLCQKDPVSAAQRLRELKFQVPRDIDAILAERTEITSSQRELARSLMLHPDALSPAQSDPAAVTKGQLLCAAARMERDPGDVAEELVQLGFSVPDDLNGRAQVSAHRRVARTGIIHRSSREVSYEEAEVLKGGARFLRHASEENEALEDLGFQIRYFTKRDELTRAARQAAEVTVTPTAMRISARLTGFSQRTIRVNLKKLGRDDIVTGKDPAYEQILIRYCKGQPTVLGRRMSGNTVRLAEIAAAALIVRRPFREVAAAATELGFRHEAEGWFGDPIREPSSEFLPKTT